MAERFTDFLTHLLALALAGAVLTFAYDKVTTLNEMENPPANLGLNFPPAKRKVIMDDSSDSDPLTTQSLPATSRARPMPAGDGGLYAYELLAVVDGVAFVAVDSAADKTLVPATIGTRLPGGLSVTAIGRQDGRWVLRAGNLVLNQRLPVQ